MRARKHHEEEIKRKKAKHTNKNQNMLWARMVSNISDNEKRDPEADKQANDLAVTAYQNGKKLPNMTKMPESYPRRLTSVVS